MKGFLERRAVALAAATAVLVGAWPGTAAAGAARPRRIVIVSVPGVTWSDVDAGRAPTLASLADRWAVAAMSVRTAGPVTDPASAYASLGAGNRARGLGGSGRLVAPETVDAPGGQLRWPHLGAGSGASFHWDC